MDTLTRMRAFIQVVDAEGFSAAARKAGRSKALLSKYVRELEDELGALLLNRTTRKFSLTEAGQSYYQRAVELVREIDALSESVRESASDIRGRIKLSASRTFADAPIGQSFIDFAVAHPDIVLDIHLDDRFVDLVEEGFDLAIRITKLDDSSLIARRLLPFRLPLFASPGLIEKYGRPKHPRELQGLPCIVDTNGRFRHNWPFQEGGTPFTVAVSGRIEANSPLAVRAAAVAGIGFAFVPDFIALPEVRAGRLVTVLDDFITDGAGIFVVYPHRRYLPAKVRALVDFLAQWLKDNPGSETHS
ncbi:LysR family transcriptional regulator [Chelativorans sp. AA-79]|uniref:LysR family transcriptional regulator n=1 Tax=Chelativorans sp. AA-79 TaxID=3028735 RepID=UPI0023F84F79|nr:LysR family transcriptional regulator [Chelativorans sp. AA-79]WEX10383.1 LysR family transcriptional regulator [Chelativorans sp. AA-79]